MSMTNNLDKIVPRLMETGVVAKREIDILSKKINSFKLFQKDLCSRLYSETLVALINLISACMKIHSFKWITDELLRSRVATNRFLNSLETPQYLIFTSDYRLFDEGTILTNKSIILEYS